MCFLLVCAVPLLPAGPPAVLGVQMEGESWLEAVSFALEVDKPPLMCVPGFCRL